MSKFLFHVSSSNRLSIIATSDGKFQYKDFYTVFKGGSKPTKKALKMLMRDFPDHEVIPELDRLRVSNGRYEQIIESYKEVPRQD